MGAERCPPPIPCSETILALYGPNQKPTGDVALQRDGHRDHRDNHDQYEHGHVPPLRAARGVLGGYGQRQRLRVGVGQEQRDQVLVPGEDQHEQEGGYQPRQRQRQHDGPEGAVAGGPVDGGALFQLDGHALEVVAHQPDDDGQVGGGVGDDQRRPGIEQVQPLEQDVDRDDHRHRRQHPLRDEPEGDVVVAQRALKAVADNRQQQDEHGQAGHHGDLPGHAEIYGDDDQRHADQEGEDGAHLRPVGEARQGVGAARAEEQRQHRAAERHHNGIPVGPEGVVAQVEEDIVPVVEGGLEVYERDIDRPAVDVDRLLERGDDQPVEGKQDDDGPQPQQQVRGRGGQGRWVLVVVAAPLNPVHSLSLSGAVGHALPDQVGIGHADHRHHDQEQIGHRRRAADIQRAPDGVGVQGQRFR